MKEITIVEKPVKRNVVVKKTVKCDMCNKVLKNGDLVFDGFTMDCEGPYAFDTFDSFQTCSYECLCDKMKKYIESCKQYPGCEAKIEFTLERLNNVN